MKRNYLIIILYGIIMMLLLMGFGNVLGSEVDWLGQHVAFPDTFRQAFYESKQLFPNFLFGIGGGQNIFHVVYYGFLSPGVLLSYLLPFVDMTVYMVSLSIVSYLISGVLVYRFLKKHFDEKKALLAALLFMTLPPITFHMHHHIMFVLYLPYFVLALIGLDRFFEKQKWGLFVISVIGIILTNYYFSVGCLVFLMIYAMYRMFQESWSWKRMGKMILIFLIPVFICGFLLLPTAYALITNSRSVEIKESIDNLLFPKYYNYFYSHESMGIPAVLLVAVIGNLTKKGKKKADLFLNIVFMVMLSCPSILYALNGMLYVRGKVFIAFAVILIYNFCKFIENLEKQEVNIKLTAIFSCVYVFLFIFADKTNLLLAIPMFMEIVLFLLLQKKKKGLFVTAIVMTMIASLGINVIENYISVDEYKEMYQDEINDLLEIDDEEFYRSHVAYQEKHTANRLYGNDFHGSSIYSSTANQRYQTFYETYMGNNEPYRNCFITAGATNELFYHYMGTRYIVGEKDPGLYYELKEEGEHLNLYVNKHAYPIVYKSSNLMSEGQFDESVFPHNIEYLLTHTVVNGGPKTEYKSGLKNHDVKESYTFIQEKEESYTIVLGEEYRNKILYLSFNIENKGDYRNANDITISINGVKNKLTAYDWMYYNGNTTFDYVIPMEDCVELDITVSKGKYDIWNLKMFTSEMIETQVEEVEDLAVDEATSKITCKTNGREGEYLVTTIPYDKGFTASINNRKVDVEIVNKAFVGLKLEEGINEIEISYRAPFLVEGMMISAFGVGLLLVILFWKRCKEMILYLMFGVLTTGVSITTYFLCTHTFLDANHGMQLQIANIIAWFISVLFAYITNRKFVFGSRNSILKEGMKFYLSRGGTLLIDMVLMFILVTIFGFNDGVSKIVVQVVVMVCNYVLGKLLVFKEEYK